jgi:hypothetical protein
MCTVQWDLGIRMQGFPATACSRTQGTKTSSEAASQMEGRVGAAVAQQRQAEARTNRRFPQVSCTHLAIVVVAGAACVVGCCWIEGGVKTRMSIGLLLCTPLHHTILDAGLGKHRRLCADWRLMQVAGILLQKMMYGMERKQSRPGTSIGNLTRAASGSFSTPSQPVSADSFTIQAVAFRIPTAAAGSTAASTPSLGMLAAQLGTTTAVDNGTCLI